jgi:glycosyltransferase involved in cell wall biosynthesis
LYRQEGLTRELSERIAVIGNYAEYPANPLEKSFTGRLTILYVGRGSDGKRVHLLGRLARLCREHGLDVRFMLVGGLEQAVRDEDRPYCCFIDEKRSFSDLARFYREAHVFAMTSVREGVPLGLLDAMAYGLVPIVTAVGGIPEHVLPGRTGYLFDAGLGEDQMLEQMLTCLATLEQNRSLLAALSAGAAGHAHEHFCRDDFERSWREMILGS